MRRFSFKKIHKFRNSNIDRTCLTKDIGGVFSQMFLKCISRIKY